MDDLDAAIDGLSQPAPEADDPIGAAVDNVISMDKARTGGAIRSAITVNPDQAAKAKAIASRAGLPQDLVMRNLPEMEAKDTAARIEAVSERSNVLSSMFRDRPDFGQIAHDDVDNLSAIERIYQDREKRASQPIDVFRTGKAYAGALPEGVLKTAGAVFSGASEGFDIAARGLRSLAAPMLPAGVLEFMDRTTMPEWMDPKQQFLKKPGEGLKNLGRIAGPEGEDRTFGTDVVAGIGQVSTQIAAALLTGGAASAGMLATQGIDTMTEKVAQDEATQAEKDVAVLLGAGWTAVTEKYGLDKLLNRVPPAVKNAALRKIADIAAGAGIEAAQEMAEGIGQDVIRRVFTDPDAEIGKGILNEGSVAGAVGGIVRAALGVRARGAQVQQAKDDAASMEALDKLAQESKVRERSPADWQSFMQEVAKDGPVKDVYIDARDLDESALRNLVEASPAAAQQAAESLASGVDMQIPSAEFGANVFGQGFAQSIIPHLKTDPNGMTLTQADAAGKTEKQDQERVVTDTLAKAGDEDAWATSRAAVEADVLRQLNETGRFTEAANKPNAALWAARYATLGARLGITPEEAYKRFPATITATPPAGAALEQPAYHGSPHRGIEQFTTQKIGTGEGVQAYGWGLYFAQSKDIAEFYRRTLTAKSGPANDVANHYLSQAGGDRAKALAAYDAFAAEAGLSASDTADTREILSSEPGQTYTVEVPDDSDLLDYDASLKDQPEKVRKALEFGSDQLRDMARRARELRKSDTDDARKEAATLDALRWWSLHPDATGSEAYRMLGAELGSHEAASRALFAAGIPGLRYLDAGSRGAQADKQTRNYVIFDDSAVKKTGSFYQTDQPQASGAIAQQVDQTPAASARDTGKRSPITGKPIIELLDADGNVIEKIITATTTAEALDTYAQRPERRSASAAMSPPRYFAEPEALPPRSNWKQVKGQEFTSLDEDDGYLYHVAPAPSAKGIREKGLVPNAGGTFGGFYAGYSAGKVFLTERSGVSYWQEKVAQQLEHAMEKPPAVIVMRIPKTKVTAKLQPDEIGTKDAGAPAYYSTDTLFQTADSAAKQADQTETPEFKRWFGDSKVVDESGKPLVVYHGTGADFTEFKQRKGSVSTIFGAEEVGRQGFFFTPDRSMAQTFGANVKEVYLALKNPFDVRNGVSEQMALNLEKQGVSESYLVNGDFWEKFDGEDGPAFVTALKAAGYDGVVFNEPSAAGQPGGDAYVAFRPEQIKSAIGNSGTFDPSDPSILNQGQQPVGASGPQQPAVRGTYTPEAKTIALLKDANWSTFVHESGHLYLDQTAQIAAEADAPAEIKADMQTLLDWFGIKAEEGASALEVWNRMTVDQQREHHEKFARGFEAFAWEGKAPSVALSGAFQRFRGWMRNLYRSLTGLNVQLTDEVRAVMSRMIATDEEIAQAKAAQSMGIMFDQAAAEKLGIDYRAYQELDRESTDEAASELDQRRLGDLKWYENAKSAALRERQREVADIRRQVKAEARTIVMSRPVYRAWAFLTGKSGQAVVPGVTDVAGADETAMVGKLRTSAIADSMGDAADAPWRKLIALRMTNDTTGMHPDIVAEMFGYASGQELVTDLVNSPTPSVSIEAQTDSLMLERYGDITSQEALERAAVEAVYNKARTRVIATELTALEKAAKVTKKTVNDAARAFAAQVVGRQKVGDLRPEKFEAAARKAGQASLKAFKAGDIQKAATEKRNELINTYAARSAREAKDDIDKKVKLYTKAANKSIIEVAKTRDADTVQAMRAILAEYGIGAKGEPAQKYIDALKSHDPDTHARLAESIDALTANAQPYTGISVDDFRTLADNIDAMWQLARRSRQMEIDGDLIDVQEAQEAVTAAIEAEGVPARIAGEGRAVTEGEKTTAILRSARAALRRVESWVYARDGGPQGAFRKFVFNPIKTSADNYRAAQAQYRKRYLDLLSKLDLKAGRIDAPELGYVFGYSKGGSGKQEILHAILHTGNDSNKRKLLLGRKWADLNEDGTIDTSRWDAFVKRMVDQGVITKGDYDFAQGVWDLLEETKAGAQQTHRQVFGRSFDEVTANSFATPFGTYRGGYVPAMADPDAVSDAKTRAILEEENQTMAHAFPSTAKGFTKGRVEYNKPLLLDLRSLGGHLDKVLMFTHLEAAVRDVRRLLGNSKVREPLSRLDSSAYDGMLIPWLNRAARQQSEAPVPAYNGLMKWLSKARSRAGMASMIGNVVNSAQQVTGFAVAALRVKPRYLRSALVEYVKNPRKAAETVASASPYMDSRMRNEVAQMNLAIDEILLNPNVYQRAQAWTARHGYFMQSAVDNVMGPIIWTGAYNEAIEQGASELDARRQADSAIRETQGSTLPEDISQFEAGNAFTRLFTQFQGYFNMQANLLGTEFAKAQRESGLRSGMGRGLYVFTLGFLAPAVVGALIAEAGKGGPDDEDGDGYLDDWLAALGIGTAKSAFAMVPGAGQVGVLVFNAANNKLYDDKASLSPAVSMVEAAARSPVSAYSAIAGEGSARKAVRDVGSLIQLTTGLPGGAVARPLGYAAGLATGEIDPTGPADLARGLITGNPSPESKR